MFALIIITVIVLVLVLIGELLLVPDNRYDLAIKKRPQCTCGDYMHVYHVTNKTVTYHCSQCKCLIRGRI